MKFSVIIPTYNDWLRLMKCLEALENQTIGKDQYQIIVADNSEDGVIPEEINLPGEVQVVHEPKPGSYAARNKGAEVAVGEILAFTDSDCIPDKNWLKNTQKYFDGRCDLVGGKVEIFQPEDGSKFGYLYESATAFPQERNVPRGKGVTANLFVKKDVFEEVGGFDSTVKSGGDWDFTLRCTRQGYRMIYGDDVKVKHPARSLVNIFKKQYRLTCWGAVNVQNTYGHSQMHILLSHAVQGINFKRDDLPDDLSLYERITIFTIDMLRYLYRMGIHCGLLLRLINPRKIRK